MTKYENWPRCVSMRSQNSPGTLLDGQSKEILDLRTRNQNRNSIGEADHDGPRNELHRRAHAGYAKNDEQHAGHHRAHEQSIHAVHGDNSRDHHYERARRSADLRSSILPAPKSEIRSLPRNKFPPAA